MKNNNAVGSFLYEPLPYIWPCDYHIQVTETCSKMAKLRLFILLNLFILSTSKTNHSVTKRSLLFPRATVLQVCIKLFLFLVLKKNIVGHCWFICSCNSSFKIYKSEFMFPSKLWSSLQHFKFSTKNYSG